MEAAKKAHHASCNTTPHARSLESEATEKEEPKARSTNQASTSPEKAPYRIRVCDVHAYVYVKPGEEPFAPRPNQP